ncbi:MAG: recombinase RecT, partial [Waterburya sp.]
VASGKPIKRGLVERVKDTVEKRKSEMMTLIPKHLDREAFLRTIYTLSAKKEFQDCCLKSFVTSFVGACQLGLLPNNPLGQAYILPFKNKSGGLEAQLIIGYRGMIDLARRSNEIETIDARCVYDGDEFDVTLGLEPNITHKPNFKSKQDDDSIIFAYAVATLKGGGKQFEILTSADIAKARMSSKTADKSYSPWATHFSEMCRKTAIRKLFKYLPVSIEALRGSRLDEIAESNDNTQTFSDDDIYDAETQTFINNIGD